MRSSADNSYLRKQTVGKEGDDQSVRTQIRRPQIRVLAARETLECCLAFSLFCERRSITSILVT
jgi:hypothetical protein